MNMKTSTDHLPSFGPCKTEVDLSYLENYGSREKYQIPTYFSISNLKRGQCFEARTTHIFDPSKFWIVVKFRELEMFQKFLFRFYYTYMNRIRYKIPQEKIQLEMYCVAFVDNAYYRGVIVGFPDDQQEKPEVQIYFIDYGMIGSTDLYNIFFMAEKFMKVPQFAVRASLANTCPLTKSNWTAEEVTKFHGLVVDRILIGFVVNVDLKREILEVYLSQKNPKSLFPVSPVHEILINEKYARYFHDNERSKEGKSQYETKMKYPYLFPSHEVLETGKLPLTTSDAEFQLQIAPLASVLSRYYKKSYSTEREGSTSSSEINHRNLDRENSKYFEFGA